MTCFVVDMLGRQREVDRCVRSHVFRAAAAAAATRASVSNTFIHTQGRASQRERKREKREVSTLNF
jgi:hypothetical protein